MTFGSKNGTKVLVGGFMRYICEIIINLKEVINKFENMHNW